MTNRQITLASRPDGAPTHANFKLVESTIPEPAAGQFLVKAEYLSVDPYMRGRMSTAKSYAAPVEIDSVMVGESVGKVIASKNEKYPEGTYVSGMFGWQEYALSDSDAIRIVNPDLAPVSTGLHCLGMPGLTAYFGVMEVCKAQAGETVLVSGAAGAVGSVVGQIAKNLGCRAVGIAGSDEKIGYITDELGYDAGVNYKSTDNYYLATKPFCPDGVDCYFDNVGGPITDQIFPLLNVHARVAICGQISMYNATEVPMGPRLFGQLIVKRATVQGLLVTDYHRQFRNAFAQLADWYQAGKLKCRERITVGIENAPTAFIEMLQGANIGKQLVKMSD